MDRRDFLRASAAALALPAVSRYALGFAAEPAKRVGLIGCGWYGKMRSAASAPGVACRGRFAVRRGQKDARRGSRTGGWPAGIGEEAAAVRRLPRNAGGERPGHRADRHAGPLACPADDRRRRGGSRRLRAKADQRGRGRRPGDARRGTPVQARCAGGHAAAQHSALISRPATESSKRASWAASGWSSVTATITCVPAAIRPDTAPPDYLDYEMWTGPAPLRPYNSLVHPRTWRSFMEYSNGIVGDMCIHMFDMVRWMLGLGWPTRVASSGGILVEKQSKANIADTQTATFDYGDLRSRRGSIAPGAMPLTRNIPGAPRSTAKKAR